MKANNVNGKITGGIAECGGGVYLTGASTLTVESASITDNIATGTGHLKYSADLWIGPKTVAKIGLTGKATVGNVFIASDSTRTDSAGLTLKQSTITSVFVQWNGIDTPGRFTYTDGTVTEHLMETNSSSSDHTKESVTPLKKGETYMMSAEASTGNIGYETLNMACKAAQSGATIKVLKENLDCVDAGTKVLSFTGYSLNHNLKQVEAKSATCTEDGNNEYKLCERCHKAFKTDGTTETTIDAETIRATGHTIVVTRQAKAATCTEDGYTADSYCSVCNEILSTSQVIKAVGHVPVVIEGEDSTCTESGHTSRTFCSVCGAVLSPGRTIPATGHSWNSGTVTKEATETSEGAKTFRCTVCGEIKTETTPKLPCAHSWDSGTITEEPTCGSQGQKTFKCAKCGETRIESIAATGNHSWDSGTVVKEPTTTESGITEYRCSVCGQTKTATIEPKKTDVKDEDGVKTTTDTSKVVEKGEDGSETVTETTTVSKEENGKVVEKVETTTSTTQKDGATIVAESTVTEKNGQLVEKVETTKSTTQTEDSTIVSETKVTEKAGEETEKVETTTSTTQKEGATIVAETKVTEKGQEKTETIAVSIGSNDGAVKTDVSVSDGSTSGIKTVISGDVTEDSIAHAIKQADMATEAISEKVTDVSKNISVPNDNVTLSPTSLSALADSGTSLTITGDAGSIGIDSDVAGTMTSRNEDVTISIMEKRVGLTDAQKETAGTNKVIELSARSVTEDIHELGGKAMVRIDMTGMDFRSPAVFWLKDDGTSERVEAEFGDGYAAIELDHFSLYYVAETAESDDLVALYVGIGLIILIILGMAVAAARRKKTA